MGTIIGVGSSNQTDSLVAGKETVTAALDNAQIADPDFALIFCGGKHDPAEFLKGVNMVIPDTKKVGGSSFGIISENFIGYDGFEVGVTLFKSDKIRFDVFAQGELNKDEYVAGKELGKKIAQSLDGSEKGLLVFYDSSKQQDPPRLNFATPLFAGLAENLPEDLVCAGGGFLADMSLSQCYQIVDDQIFTQHVVAIKISGDCRVETAILHGCKPCSDYMTITKAEGPVVFEIDDLPAIDVVDSLLGKSMQPKEYPMNLTLGVNRGDKFDDFKEKDYANRLTLAIDEPNKALVMFEPDLKEGDEVQLMRRDFDPEYITEVVRELLAKMKGTHLVNAFYINCGGRAKPFSGMTFEDAQEIHLALENRMPYSGFYSGVEVAKVGDHLQALDWTGVLVVLGETV